MPSDLTTLALHHHHQSRVPDTLTFSLRNTWYMSPCTAAVLVDLDLRPSTLDPSALLPCRPQIHFHQHWHQPASDISAARDSHASFPRPNTNTASTYLFGRKTETPVQVAHGHNLQVTEACL